MISAPGPMRARWSASSSERRGLAGGGGAGEDDEGRQRRGRGRYPAPPARRPTSAYGPARSMVTGTRRPTSSAGPGRAWTSLFSRLRPVSCGPRCGGWSCADGGLVRRLVVVLVARRGAARRPGPPWCDRPRPRCAPATMVSWSASSSLSRRRFSTPRARRRRGAWPGVPGRGEKAAAKTASKRTSRRSASVVSCCSSVSPQKPDDDVRGQAMPGIAARSRSTRPR